MLHFEESVGEKAPAVFNISVLNTGTWLRWEDKRGIAEGLPAGNGIPTEVTRIR